jgi:hypothetical protein
MTQFVRDKVCGFMTSPILKKFVGVNLVVSSISNMKHMCGVYHSNFDISVVCAVTTLKGDLRPYFVVVQPRISINKY